MAVPFEIGEIVNPEHHALRVQISGLDPLEAIVVKNASPGSYVGRFFPVGRSLRFVRIGQDDQIWRIDTSDGDMPWFVLGVFAGRRRFEHYR